MGVNWGVLGGLHAMGGILGSNGGPPEMGGSLETMILLYKLIQIIGEGV